MYRTELYCGQGYVAGRILFYLLQVFAAVTGKKNQERPLSAAAGQSEKSDAAHITPETAEKAERLLGIYGSRLLRFSYSYLHNMADAEDILQETMIRFVQTQPVFENAAHEKAWLFRVAANLSKNRIDYNRRRDTDELEEELAAKDRQDLSFVWEAVKQLPVRYREVIHLFYYEGYSTAEIAQILGEKEATVRSHLNRGRSRLKDILKEAYDFEE